MKKIFTFLLGIGAVTSVSAQSQRLVLTEEFTQASCGPCASQNPDFNTLLDANAGKIISIKYQTSWPGTDPMNAENTTDVANRVSYYGVSGVPFAPMDGDTMVLQSPNYGGAPANYTQSIINAAYAIPSPYTIAINHHFSAAYDSIYITADITCTQAITGTSQYFRLAIVEKEIRFITPPGTNGELDFYNVMRKMLPNATGTALASSWAVNDHQTLTFAAKLPTYIRDLNQIAVVGFIQDDATQLVHQAGYSAPQQLQVDAAISSIASIKLLQCNTDVSPVATIKNVGVQPLTTATINYTVDNGTPVTLPWTGNLATGASQTVVLGPISLTSGAHTIKVYTTNINNTNDYNVKNDATSVVTNIITSYSNSPLQMSFPTAAFPPAGWIKYNPDGAASWTRKGSTNGFAAGTTGGSAKMDFFNSPPGQIDELILQPLDLSGITNPVLTFNVAYAMYDGTTADKLEVMVSTDCGNTWTSKFSKAGTTLKTSANTTTGFTPTTAAQWRAESVDLSSVGGNSSVLVKFKATSDYGNNLYLDDIFASTVTGIKPVRFEASTDRLFPNPAIDATALSITLEKAAAVTVLITDATGKVIATNTVELIEGLNEVNLNTENCTSGIYFVKVVNGDSITNHKLIIQK